MVGLGSILTSVRVGGGINVEWIDPNSFDGEA